MTEPATPTINNSQTVAQMRGIPMTDAEYLDPQRFPLTTRPGLALQHQQLIDAVNMDDLP